ncbi:vWA domain-containing protein [Cohaesibacter gelatinilyticus]|uniref:Ca-activated chloride channel family protein n=1 Tax=Cohaesibacter gelatinilyticus TaxID=372072 RepID=A0A285NI20_9HYPH|nr:VWA domain-containing protein [Cohaesibacter gelatinilyticus]SNZ07516.1 Ca-activated chloride channel family protein [Cohaesibacter gelatinilyticus]
MSLLPQTFHFLRPDWFWALIPAGLATIALFKASLTGSQDNWSKYIDPHLLAHLSLSGKQQKKSRLFPLGFAVLSALLITAMAGPSWQKSDIPSFSGGEPVVMVLSLAQSMNADDLSPSRLKRAGHKLRDILERTQGDDRGLVIYSDAPFVATPLTNDPKVIEQMLPELSTNLMPVLGNRLDLALDEATNLLQRAGATSGKVILLADDMGNDPKASMKAATALNSAGFELSVLAVGTEKGATLQTSNGQAIANRKGETFVTKVPVKALTNLAKAGGGQMAILTAGSQDLDQLLPKSKSDYTQAGKANDFKADSWVDMGYWLLVLPVLFAAFAFRRGLVFVLALTLAGTMVQPETAAASVITASSSNQSVWKDLWQTRDQQGETAFKAKNFAGAAASFEKKDWKSAALYRAGDYAKAAQSYASVNGQDQGYNLGNALAKSGNLEGALKAYDDYLNRHPDSEDAKFNRDLIAKLLEQQKQQEQKQQNQKQDQQQDQKGQDQQQGQKGQDQQQDQKGQDQQQGQKGQDQQQDQKSQDQQQGQKDQDQQQGQKGQDQQQGQKSQDQQQGQKSQDQQQGQKDQDQQTENQATGRSDQESRQQDKDLLSKLVSDMFDGNSDHEQEEQVEADIAGTHSKPLNQAVEQQLRRVPDDPSGLLRARIRQHYSRLRANQR